MLEHAHQVHKKRLRAAGRSTPLTRDTIGKYMQRAFWIIVLLRVAEYLTATA